MAKDIPLAIIDSMLDLAEGDQLHICSAQPTTYTEATTTFQLATFTVTGGNYTKANGDVSGRKNTLAALTGATIDNTGGTITNSATGTLTLVNDYTTAGTFTNAGDIIFKT